MNDLPLVTQSYDMASFVDDSKVYLSFTNDYIDQATQNLETDLGRVAKWCSDKQLLINPDKTKLVLIGNRQLYIFCVILSNLSCPLKTWE